MQTTRFLITGVGGQGTILASDVLAEVGLRLGYDAKKSDILGLAVRGGSAGPLYGTLIGGLGAQLGDDENELSADAVRRMFAGCLAEMQDITTAQVGDKTMMDALIPAVKAAQACAAPDDGPVDVLMAAAEAAEEGARASEGFASKFGRARSYGDRTIGTPDAGAVSTSLFLRGLANGASLPRS